MEKKDEIATRDGINKNVVIFNLFW